MIFTYTYRDRTGASAHGEIDATDRTAAVAALRSRGIVPIKLESGKGRQGCERRPFATSGQGKGTPVPRWWLWSGVALFAIAVGSSLFWWLHSPRGASTPVEGKPSRQKSVTDKGKRPEDLTRDGADRVSQARQITNKPKTASMPQSVQTSDVASSSAPPPQETNIVAELPEKPAPVFSNVTDQVITMALSPSDGGMPPIPLTPDMEQAFLKSLQTEIVILDTDDEKTRALKQSVKETREEVKRLMDKGMTFAQIIRDHQRLVNENAKVRQELLLELKRIRDSGDIEGAVKFKREMNAALQQMGIRN